jgi:hypothetical protein
VFINFKFCHLVVRSAERAGMVGVGVGVLGCVIDGVVIAHVIFFPLLAVHDFRVWVNFVFCGDYFPSSSI